MAQRSDRPLVSVVIPSYNHAKYIAKTIDSIFAQTILSQVELIIIDDGSPDDSVKVIEESLKGRAPSNVTFVKRENRGLCRTLNEALLIAKGKYFSYVGSDDLLAAEKLEVQIEACEAAGGNVGASYSDCFVIDSEDNILDTYGRQFPFRGGDIYLDLLAWGFQPTSPTNFFLREALLSVGGFNENHYIEDQDAWVRVAKIYNVIYIPQPLAYFRTHGKNTGSNNPEKMHNYTRQVIAGAVRTDPSLAFKKYFMEAAVTADEAGNYLELLQLSRARKFAVKAIRQNPFNRSVWRTLFISFLGTGIV